MKVLFLLLWLLPLSTGAQKKSKDTTLIYLDQQLRLTGAKNAAFAGVTLKVAGGWMVYALYPDTTPLIRAYFKDRHLTVKHGPFTQFHPKHKKAYEGYYNNNSMTGTWRFWHQNGQLKDSGRVENNFMVGQWKSWHPNGALMTDTYFKEALSEEETNALLLLHLTQTQLPYNGIRQGRHQSWYSNGQPESSGSFANNRMEGRWLWYHANGAPATEEMYKEGLVTALQCFDTTGQPAGNLCSIDKPALLKYHGDYKAFIYQNLTWPKEARKKGIQGDVLVQFTVNQSGTLETLTITASEPLLKKAVEALFAQMKEWDPAISHNRTVAFTDEMVIPFRL